MQTSTHSPLLQQGAEAHLSGKLPEAEALYRKALEDEPDHAVLLNNLGFLLTQTGRFSEAEAAYRKALQADPDYATAWSNLGQCSLLMRRWQDAEGYLQRALQLDAQNLQALEGLAQLYTLGGDPERAESYWRTAYELRPSGSLLLSLAHNLLQQQKITEAEACLESAYTEEKDNPRLYALLGAVNFAKKDFGSATKYFRFSLGLEPDDTEVRHNLAMTYLQSGQGYEAIRELERIVSLAPDSAEYRNNLGVLLLSAGRWKESMAQFDASLARQPANEKALYYRSLGCIRQGHPDEARSCLNRILALGTSEYAQQAADMLQALNESKPETEQTEMVSEPSFFTKK